MNIIELSTLGALVAVAQQISQVHQPSDLTALKFDSGAILFDLGELCYDSKTQVVRGQQVSSSPFITGFRSYIYIHLRFHPDRVEPMPL